MSSAVEKQSASGNAVGVTEPLPNEITGTNNESRSDNSTIDMQKATTLGKKTKKSKSIASRGPTALPKRCGTGFEGMRDPHDISNRPPRRSIRTTIKSLLKQPNPTSDNLDY